MNRTIPAVGLLLALGGALPGAVVAQTYECTTTETTTTRVTTYSDGSIVITSITVSSTLCHPI